MPSFLQAFGKTLFYASLQKYFFLDWWDFFKICFSNKSNFENHVITIAIFSL